MVINYEGKLRLPIATVNVVVEHGLISLAVVSTGVNIS
jgi:hypothetical protein